MQARTMTRGPVLAMPGFAVSNQCEHALNPAGLLPFLLRRGGSSSLDLAPPQRPHFQESAIRQIERVQSQAGAEATRKPCPARQVLPNTHKSRRARHQTSVWATQVQTGQCISAAQVGAEQLWRAGRGIDPNNALAARLLTVVRDLASTHRAGAIEVQNGRFRGVFVHACIVGFY